MLTRRVAVISGPCIAPIESCIWRIAPPEFCSCSITILPSFSSAGVVVSISVVAVAGVRRVIESCRCTLADFLGVFTSSLFTSLLGVIVVKGLLEDPLLNLLPWLLTGDKLD